MTDEPETNEGTEQETDALGERIKNLLRSPAYILCIDIVRVLLIVGVIILIAILVKEIETVKILGSDVCALCMNKTGAICQMPVGYGI